MSGNGSGSDNGSRVSASGVLPQLSIVIVNWNGKGFLEANLKSLLSQTYKLFELLFVDNGSSDGSVEFARSLLSGTGTEVTFIRNRSNRGFAAANNQGFAKARGEFILTLNNDTVLEKNCLEQLMDAALTSEEGVGMWAPKILSMSDSGVIDSVGGLLLYPNGIGRGQGRMERDTSQFDSIKEALMPSACAGLYRKAMLDEVGYFDPDFFAYCEDTDLGLRARIAGWSCLSVPGAVLFHHYSGTSGSHTPFKAYLVERNHVWVVLKNFPPLSLLLFPFYEVWRYVAQVVGVLTGKGAGARLAGELSFAGLMGIVVRAYAGALVTLPATISKRKDIKKRARITSGQFRALLKRYSISAAELALKD